MNKSVPRTPPKAKVAKVMGEFKRNTLRSGSKKGAPVTNRKQAVAIALSEAKDLGPRGGIGGFSLPRQPRVLNNPRSLGGRRAASHKLANPDKY